MPATAPACSESPTTRTPTALEFALDSGDHRVYQPQEVWPIKGAAS